MLLKLNTHLCLKLWFAAQVQGSVKIKTEIGSIGAVVHEVSMCAFQSH